MPTIFASLAASRPWIGTFHRKKFLNLGRKYNYHFTKFRSIFFIVDKTELLLIGEQKYDVKSIESVIKEPFKDIEKESNEIDELLEDVFEEEPKSLNFGGVRLAFCMH